MCRTCRSQTDSCKVSIYMCLLEKAGFDRENDPSKVWAMQIKVEGNVLENDYLYPVIQSRAYQFSRWLIGGRIDVYFSKGKIGVVVEPPPRKKVCLPAEGKRCWPDCLLMIFVFSFSLPMFFFRTVFSFFFPRDGLEREIREDQASL